MLTVAPHRQAGGRDRLDRAKERLGNVRIVLGQNLKAHMLLRDPLNSRRERTEIFNIAGIGENGARERTRLAPPGAVQGQ